MNSRTCRPLPIFLLSVLSVVGCERGAAAEGAVLITDFVERSPEVRCRNVPALDSLTIHAEVVEGLPDGRVLAVDALARRIWIVDGGLVAADSIALDLQGPRGVGYPRSAALRPDGGVVIADGMRRSLLLLPADGAEPERIELDFSPDRVFASGDGSLFVTRWALEAGTRPLLHRIDGSGPAEPVGLAPRRERDLRMQAVGNQLALVGAGEAGVLALHRALHPVGYRIAARGGAVDTLAIPLPDGVRGSLGFRPRPPYTDEDVLSLLVPVVDAAAAPPDGAFLLTYTGRRRGEERETGVIRVGPRLEAGPSALLPFEATHLTARPGGDSLLVVDGSGGWHLCPAP